MPDLLKKPHPHHTSDQELKPPRRLSREEVARIELGHTTISRRTAWALVIGFLVTIFTVPVGQHVISLVRWSRTDASLAQSLPPIYEVRELLPTGDQIASVRSWQDAYHALPTSSQIKAFETSLEERSELSHLLIPNIQWLLTTYGGTGNEQALTGRDGWLFYKPAVQYLTGQPFLDENRLAQIHRYTDRAADPRPAILQLHQQLADRGISLVLMPTPGKAQVHPEMLATGYDGETTVLQNPSYSQFIDGLQAAGVTIFDPGPMLVEQKSAGAAQYLETDTHWTPAAMQQVAQELAKQLAGVLPDGDPGRYQQTSQPVSNIGDIAVMLKLPEWQTIYPPQTVTIAPVRDGDNPWTSTRNAPILLLGDSFANIFSQLDLGWGEGAGLAEQLSFATGLPVDRIIINAGGAHATRQRLAADLGRDASRLDGVNVVVWQFAQRELLEGDWRPINLPEPSDTPTRIERHDDQQMVVRGTIRAIGRPPEPGTVPYRDCLVAIHLDQLSAIEGTTEETELLVFIHGMRDNRLTPAARWSVGQQVELALIPWDQTNDAIQSTQQQLTDTDADFTITTWWYSPPPAAAAAGE